MNDNCYVTVDDRVCFPAYNGGRWNGHVVPYFTRNTVTAIVSWFNTAEQEQPPNDRASMVFIGDEVHRIPSANEEYDEAAEVTVYEPNSEGRYGIGSGVWTWKLTDPGTGNALTPEHASEAELLDHTRFLIGTTPGNTAGAPRTWRGTWNGLWTVYALNMMLRRQEAITAIALVDELHRNPADRRPELARRWAAALDLTIPDLRDLLETARRDRAATGL